MKKILETLENMPGNKMPPVEIYKKLVDAFGVRNSWNCKQWIVYIKNK